MKSCVTYPKIVSDLPRILAFKNISGTDREKDKGSVRENSQMCS